MELPKLVAENQEYFGVYSVMALLNAQTVLDHIQLLAGLESSDAYKEKAEDLWKHPVVECLNPYSNGYNDHPEVVMYVMEKLQTYFPFLKVLGENQREYKNEKSETKRLEVNSSDLYDVLGRMFRVLKKYRDMTNHYGTTDANFEDGSKFLTGIEQPLAIMMNNYYTVALRNAKEKYDYTTQDVAFIQNNRMKNVTTPDGKRKKVNDLNFPLGMLSYNNDATRRFHLSGAGVAMLCCMFLDKQYINIFVTRLMKVITPILQKQYRCRPSSENTRVVVRTFGVNSIRLPKDRITMEKDNMAVAMDMLGEVKRCPDELFNTLSSVDAGRFRIISSDHNEVLQKRSTDRFTQLMLQYIDHCECFNDIRFHVNMGKLRYLFNAEKNCIDGKTRVRVLEHQLNGFGRLDDMEEKRKTDERTFADTGIRIRDFEDMKRDDADPSAYPYIVDTRTHYILENNKVEMSFGSDSVMPVIKNDNGKWYVNKQMPTCRISTLELPAMAFHILLFGGKKTEERIKEVYGQYAELFAAMRNGELNKDNIADFGIAECDLPQKVLQSLDGCAPGKDAGLFISKAIEELRADTSRRLERLYADKKAIGTKDNKMGKRNFRQIRTGVIADFLAKDIVRMLPTATSAASKLTGLNYRIMQTSIAVYDSAGDNDAKRQFKQLFERACLLGSDPNTCHPFLHKVFARQIPENAVEFYERYLVERMDYLDKQYLKLCKGKQISVPFVNPRQQKWQSSSQEYLGRVYGQNLTVELPRQMFDADIKACLSMMPQMADIDFGNANVTYLIAEYLKRVLNDDFQNFYSWKRNYRYIDMLKNIRDRKDALGAVFTTTEEREALWKKRDECIVGYRESERKRNSDIEDIESVLDRRVSAERVKYQKNEKVLRRYKVQDALLFMMAKNILTEQADFDAEQFKLKEIMPDADKGILSQIMPMTFTFTKGGRQYTITSEGMKLKNYGDFFVLANDKRIEALMELIETDSVDKDALTEELGHYNNCRPKVVKLVLDLEKWAFERYPELKARRKSGEDIGFYKIMELLCSENKMNRQQSYILRKIRNAFEHNVYPEKGVVEITTIPEIARDMEIIFGKYAVLP